MSDQDVEVDFTKELQVTIWEPRPGLKNEQVFKRGRLFHRHNLRFGFEVVYKKHSQDQSSDSFGSVWVNWSGDNVLGEKIVSHIPDAKPYPLI